MLEAVLTDDIVRIRIDVSRNKKMYLDLVKDDAIAYHKVEEAYTKCERAETYLTIDAATYMIDIDLKQEALKANMVSPSIVGGLTAGVFGTGAGIYAATSTAANKAAAENNISYYSAEMSELEKTIPKSEEKYVKALRALDTTLNFISKIRKARDRYLENEYQKALEYCKINKINNLKKAVTARYYFDSVRGYKDASDYYTKFNAMVKKQQNKYKLIFITLIISAIMLILLGACLMASSGYPKADSNMASFAVGLIIAVIPPPVIFTIAALIATPKSIRESIERMEKKLREQEHGPEFCHSCGTFSPADSTFCAKCGKSLKEQ